MTATDGLRAADMGRPAPSPQAAQLASTRISDPREEAVAAVMSSPAQRVDGAVTCRQAAGVMRRHRISCVLVDGRPGLAIVTDRDLRDRVLARGLDSGVPVQDVATFPVLSVPADTPLWEAAADMVAAGIHHLPVSDGDRMVGIVTYSDLIRALSRGLLTLEAALGRADSVEKVGAVLSELPARVAVLLDDGTAARAIARLLSGITDRATRRLLELAQLQMGPAPAPFGWLAFGSQGRREQTLFNDQDHGLLLADGLAPADIAWFSALAEWMTGALERCGFPPCPGAVMATNPKWRADVSTWRRHLDDWILVPSGEHLLDTATAFDVRTVAGELDAATLLTPTMVQAAKSEIFLAHMARASTRRAPVPGRIPRLNVLSRRRRATVDVKAAVMLPTAKLARLYTLARGGQELDTVVRLDAAATDGQLSGDLAASLREGYEMAMRLRLSLHARRAVAARGSNRVDVRDLSRVTRAQLRETLKAIRIAQEAVESRYLVTLLG